MRIRAATLRYLAVRIAPLWLAVYLATPLKPYLPAWAFAVIIAVPFLLLMLQDGEERVTARGTLEVIAAWWYVSLTALVFYFFLKGYRPTGWWLALIFIALGLVVYVPKLRLQDEEGPGRVTERSSGGTSPRSGAS